MKSPLERKRDSLAAELEEIRGKLSELRIEFGRLATTHPTDPSYSAARFDRLGKEIDRLVELSDGLAYDLDQIELEIRCGAAQAVN